MRVVAVFDIHIDRTAVAIMNAKITLRGPRPKILETPFTTPTATFRWAPVHSIALLSMKPHIRSRISLSPYAWATGTRPMTPNSGSTPSGIRLVAATGTGSVTHQMAHQAVTPARMACGVSRPAEPRTTVRRTHAKGPAGKAILRTR